MPQETLTPGGLTAKQVAALRDKAAYGINRPTTKRKKGRPTAYTKDRAKIVIEAIETGSTLGMAAMAAGVHKQTVNGWVRKGESLLAAIESSEDPTTYEPSDVGEWDFLDFTYRYWAARAEYGTSLEETVAAGSLSNPELALRVLMIRYPDEWGTATRSEVTLKGDPEAPIHHEHRSEAEEETVEQKVQWVAEFLQTVRESGILEYLGDAGLSATG